MRSSLYGFYENSYYAFERWLNWHILRFRSWKSHIGRKYDASFYETYRTSVRPYWRSYGIRTRAAVFKEIVDASGGPIERHHVPDDVWYRYIIPYFNDCRFSKFLADKNLNGLMYPTVKRPETLFRHMSGVFCLDDFSQIDRSEAETLTKQPGTWVIKPSIDSFQGKDVRFFAGGSGEALTLLDQYDDTDYIVQRAIVQHPALSALNPTSINTIRLMTLAFNGTVRVTSAVLRVGSPGSRVDNFGAGGLQFDIKPDGRLADTAALKINGSYAHRDLSDTPPFAGFVVPEFDRIRDTVIALAEKTPHLRLIAWDIALDAEGDPVLIEFNTRAPGQNQETSGPSFGEETDEILSAVFRKRMH